MFSPLPPAMKRHHADFKLLADICLRYSSRCQSGCFREFLIDRNFGVLPHQEFARLRLLDEMRARHPHPTAIPAPKITAMTTSSSTKDLPIFPGTSCLNQTCPGGSPPSIFHTASSLQQPYMGSVPDCHAPDMRPKSRGPCACSLCCRLEPRCGLHRDRGNHEGGQN